MVYQVAPQEILCQLPGLFMTVMTQRSSVRAKWWEVTARQADPDRSSKESLKCPWQMGPQSQGWSLWRVLFPSAFVGTHLLLVRLHPLLSVPLTLFPLLCSHPLTFSPKHSLSTELEDKRTLFIDEWLFWAYLGNLATFWTGENSGGKNGLAGDSFPSTEIHTNACFCYPFRKELSPRRVSLCKQAPFRLEAA